MNLFQWFSPQCAILSVLPSWITIIYYSQSLKFYWVQCIDLSQYPSYLVFLWLHCYDFHPIYWYALLISYTVAYICFFCLYIMVQDLYILVFIIDMWSNSESFSSINCVYYILLWYVLLFFPISLLIIMHKTILCMTFDDICLIWRQDFEYWVETEDNKWYLDNVFLF